MNSKSKLVMESQRRKKLFAVEQFGGKCQICGYDKCINALSFHHVDPLTKKESPSYIIMRKSWKFAFEELQKCILVCSNCHAEIHYADVNVDYSKYITPTMELTCIKCNEKFTTKIESQKYCSNKCRAAANYKVKKIPTKEELLQKVNSGISILAMSKEFGISDVAMKKWLVKFNIL